MGDRLATVEMGRKVGAVVPLFVGDRAGSHLTQCGLCRGLPPCQSSEIRTVLLHKFLIGPQLSRDLQATPPYHPIIAQATPT